MNATSHTAIVTGGSEGLGLALTVALAERGWNVVVDARHSQLLIEAVAPLGPSVVAVPGDINDPTHRLALVASATGVSDDGRIDLIINNASTLGPLPMPALLQLPPTDLVGVLTTNVVSPLALIQVATTHLTVDGCIINITSDAGVAAYEGWGGYGTSKSALDQLSRILAVEQPTWRVYAVDPGDMRTAMHQDAFPGQDISDRPLPQHSVAGILALINGSQPSGRYSVAQVR